MTSNNGLANYKNIFCSFVEKRKILMSLVMLMAVVVLGLCFLVAYWAETPLFVRICYPILFAIILLGVIFLLLNGMFINKKGTIIFIPDFRVKKISKFDLKRIAINFNEWDNNKYSAQIKLVSANNTIFTKDYSKQFKNSQKNKLAKALYTIKKNKVDELCNKLQNLERCVITVIDRNNTVVYQNRLSDE